MSFNVKLTALMVGAIVVASAAMSPTSVSAESGEQEAKSQTSSEQKKVKKTEKKTVKKVVVTVKPGDSLSVIAKKHKTTWVRIFNANVSIQHPDVLKAGDKLRIPANNEKLKDRYSSFVAASAPVVAAPRQVATTPVAPVNNGGGYVSTPSRSYTSAPVNSNSYYVGNGMWCTDYVHAKRPDVPIYGNAGPGWLNSARADGKATGTAPRQGAVAVTNGHVAYVEKVNRDGSYVVSEMGWNYKAGNYNKRTVNPGTFNGFIYK